MAQEQDRKFPNKYMNKLNEFAQGYTETADSADTEDLKKFILTSEKNLYEIEHEKENNANLIKLKEDLKTDMAPYTEARQTETAKIKYCLWILGQRGIEL